ALGGEGRSERRTLLPPHHAQELGYGWTDAFAAVVIEHELGSTEPRAHHRAEIVGRLCQHIDQHPQCPERLKVGRGRRQQVVVEVAAQASSESFHFFAKVLRRIGGGHSRGFQL